MEGMPGCSPGAVGRRRDGNELTGGKPGEVCFSFCCGALLAAESSSSGGVIAMFGVGASGSASSAAGAVAAEELAARSTGGGAGALRCARALKQASDVRPTSAETRRTHLRSDFECSFRMTPPFRIRTDLSEDMSPPAHLLIAAEGQTQEIGCEFLNQLAAHIARNRSGETGCRNTGA